MLHHPVWPVVGVAYRQSGPSAAKMQLKRQIRHCPVACGKASDNARIMLYILHTAVLGLTLVLMKPRVIQIPPGINLFRF